jgi:hypothetical protein
MIIGICGRSITPSGEACQAGAGKDTLADILVRKGYGKVALADPLKRILMSVWQFTEEQLWGPSHCRNKPDFRYPLEDRSFLTPRKALQALDALRQADPDCWSRVCLRTCGVLLGPTGYRYRYDRVQGLVQVAPSDTPPLRGVLVTDVRFPGEAMAIRKHGGKILLVERQVEALPEGMNLKHLSEVGLLGWGHQDFDQVVLNTDLASLPEKGLAALKGLVE